MKPVGGLTPGQSANMPSIDLSPIKVPPPTRLQEIRTSRMKQFGPVLSGIDKTPQNGQLSVAKLGLPDDEHDPTFHGGIDKAVHQYCSDHYSFWQNRFSDESVKSRFVPGGFGENLVADNLNETNICIGDLVRIGPPDSDSIGGPNGCLLEVSLPRQPCFKLNQRFGVKNFAPQTHQQAKTGWYYRVKEEGVIKAGMEIRVVKRDYPKWSIARLHHYVHRDKKDMDVTRELMGISVIGNECRKVFEKRWEQELKKADAKKRGAGRRFRVLGKTMETPRIVRLELQAVQKTDGTAIPFGSYAAIKLPNGLKRAYSVVEGDVDHFVLGVARDDNSRGGSVYIHDRLEIGNDIILDTFARSMDPNGMASHYIFIVGGIGITAFLTMMSRLLSINMTVELHYAVRTADDVAFKSLLSALGNGAVRVYDKSRGERMDIDKILRDRVWNSHIFTCGPQRMIDSVIQAGADVGMAEDEVHYEVFNADTSGDPFSVDVVDKGKKVKLDVGADNTLLEALREAGLDVSSSCETGNCGTCRINVKCGKVDHRGTGLTKEEQENEMLSCVSRGIGHIEIELPEL